MAASNNSKRKTPAKQAKTVKQADQITLEETLEKPVKKNNELKAQREARERREAELKVQEAELKAKKAAEEKAAKKAAEEKAAAELKAKKEVELKEQEEKLKAKKEAEKKAVEEKVVSIPAPKKQRKPEPQEPVYRVQPEHTKAKKKKSSKRKRKGDERVLKLSLDKNAPFVYQEAYKSLRTNINFISSTSDIKSVIITSALPQESKSNVAVNIAINMASEGKKVILVDCDLRKPVLHKYLRVGSHNQGLTDVLAGKVKLDDAIVKFKDVKVHLLPAGTIPPNPSEMLSQERMRKLVDFLKETYDFVIIDAPPVSVVTDAAVLGNYVDGAILVVRSKFAPKETIQLAKQKLENVNIKILGVVLTRYNAKNATRNSAYTYSYGYGYGYGYGDNG